MFYDKNYGLQNAMGTHKDERVVFADQVLKLNNRLRCERRDFILSVEAIYLIMRAKKVGQDFYKMAIRVPITEIQKVALSTLKDNFVVFYAGNRDFVIENEKKTEMLTVLGDYYKLATNRSLTIEFSDSINYKSSVLDARTLNFAQDPSFVRAGLKKNGRNLTISIAPGLAKNTDTTPKMLSRPVGGGSAYKPPGGGSKPAAKPQPQHQQQQSSFLPEPISVKQSFPDPVKQSFPDPVKQSFPDPVKQQPVKQSPAKQNLPPPVVSQPKAKALYPHTGGSPTELTFQTGDVLIIYKKDPGGWWEAELNGQRGWVPSNYVQEI